MIHSRKINIYHIHSDEKFVHSTRLFDFEFAKNHIFFIGDINSYKGAYKANVHFFPKSKAGLKQIICECQEADIVVVYELNYLKAYIVNRISKSTKILWRFFGTELYTKMPKRDVFSPQTLKLLHSEESIISSFANRFFTPLKRWLKWRTNLGTEFNRAMQRIDFFIGLSHTEYQYLRERFRHLPRFLQYPFFESNVEKSVTPPSSKLVVIGNNKNAFNNHLEILDILSNNKSKNDCEFVLLFNYGVENGYAREVRSRAKLIDGVTIMEEFLGREEFKNLYDGFSTLVINGYRQMAMGNIFIALRKGVKVYLNEYNAIYGWLLKEGFKVYSVSTFSEDISKDNCRLNSSIAEHNRKQFVNLAKRYNHKSFMNTIYDLAFS